MEQWVDNGEVVSTIHHQRIRSYNAKSNVAIICTCVGIVDNYDSSSRIMRDKSKSNKSTHVVRFVDFDRLDGDDIELLLSTWDRSVPISIHAGKLGIQMGTSLVTINSDSIISGVGTMFYFDMVGTPKIKRRSVKRK